MAMLNYEESPAMLDYSLTLNQEGSDAGELFKNVRFGREPDADQQVAHDRKTRRGWLGMRST